MTALASTPRPVAPPGPRVSVLAPGLRVPPTVADIAVEERDGAGILLHLKRASSLVTNEADLRAHQLADGRRTAGEILEELSEELEIPLPELELPIRSFFREVLLSGFLAPTDVVRGTVHVPRHALPVWVQSLFFHLTDICNITCSHCYRASGTSFPAEHTERSKERIFELLDELVEHGGRSMSFTGGGEPLARPDCLEILRYAGARVSSRFPSRSASMARQPRSTTPSAVPESLESRRAACGPRAVSAICVGRSFEQSALHPHLQIHPMEERHDICI